MSHTPCKQKCTDKVCFHLRCPNDVKKLCDLASQICPPVPQPAPVRSGGALDFGGALSNVSGTNFNLLIPWQHGSAVQAIVVPTISSTAAGAEFLVPGANNTQKVITGVRLLPQASLTGITFIVRVNNVPTSLRVTTTNTSATGSVTVNAGDTVSVVADLTGISPSALITFATVTMELI